MALDLLRCSHCPAGSTASLSSPSAASSQPKERSRLSAFSASHGGSYGDGVPGEEALGAAMIRAAVHPHLYITCQHHGRYKNLGHQNKPAIVLLPDDMDSYHHPPRAFHQLKDADVALAKLVFTHKLEKLQVLQTPVVGRVIVFNQPLLFSVWPTKYGIM